MGAASGSFQHRLLFPSFENYQPPPVILELSRPCHQPLQNLVATEFNKFFSSVADPSRVSKLKKNNSNASILGPVSSMMLSPVGVDEVARVIQNFPSKLSEDVNGVSMWLIKQCSESIVCPLTKMINLSFGSGVFPMELKKAKVVPVFKKDDPTVASNYRPISILPVLSKVFEKVFLERLFTFLEKHKILSESQFGFRPGKSTIDAVTELVDMVVEGLENKQQTLSVFIDLSKAFDCVEHSVLLNRLECYGVRGTPLNWLKSYLNDRSQVVQISGSVSDQTVIQFGVPQGSILGPVLFLVYVNNVPSSISQGQIIQYADDTTLCFRSQSLKELEISTFENLNSCIQYFQADNLMTNHSKTNYLKFSLRNLNPESNLSVLVDDVTIEEAESVKFLGIHLDRCLSWSVHIDKICGKISSGLFALRSISKYCNTEVQLMAYFGLIYPHLCYGIRLWGSCAIANFKRVFRLQKEAVRIIGKLNYRESCRQTFRNLGLLTLAGIYIFETILYCRKNVVLTQGSDIHRYGTRARHAYRVAQHRTSSFEHLPSQMGVKFLNALPENLRSEQNFSKFKARLKGYLVASECYSVGEFIGQ